MTTYYVDSTAGSNTSPYDTWAKAAADLATVDSLLGDGDLVLCHYAHSKSYTASQTLETGSASYRVRIISVDKDDSNKYRAGASELCTTGAMIFDIPGAVYGMTLGCTTSGQSTGLGQYGCATRYYNCVIETGRHISCGGGSVNAFFGCQFDFNSYAGVAYMSGNYAFAKLHGCTIVNPPTAGYPFNFAYSGCLIEDMDLSACSDVQRNITYLFPAVFRRCRFPEGTSTPYAAEGCVVMEYCGYDSLSATPLPLNLNDSGDAPGFLTYAGSVTSISSVYRTSLGADDGEASRKWCYKIASNSNCASIWPVEIPHTFTKWHDASGSKKLTIAFVGPSGLTDAEVYVRVSKPHTSGYVHGTLVNTLAMYGLSSAAGTSTYLKTGTIGDWSGSGFTTAYEFQVTGINPSEPGVISATFGLIKDSTTVFVCPNMQLTSDT